MRTVYVPDFDSLMQNEELVIVVQQTELTLFSVKTSTKQTYRYVVERYSRRYIRKIGSIQPTQNYSQFASMVDTAYTVSHNPQRT